MVGNNLSDSSDYSGIPILQVISVAKQKFNLQGQVVVILAKTFDVSSLMLVKQQ